MKWYVSFYMRMCDKRERLYVKMCCFNIIICYTRLYRKDYNGYPRVYIYIYCGKDNFQTKLKTI